MDGTVGRNQIQLQDLEVARIPKPEHRGKSRRAKRPRRVTSDRPLQPPKSLVWAKVIHRHPKTILRLKVQLMWMAVSQRKTQFRDLAVPNRFGLPLEQLQSQCHGLPRVGPILERMHVNLNDGNILIHLTVIPVAATKILEGGV